MKIYFARHGESEANLLHFTSNRGLKHKSTSCGRVQAFHLPYHLQAIPIAHMYSSPLPCTIETSVIL